MKGALPRKETHNTKKKSLKDCSNQKTGPRQAAPKQNIQPVKGALQDDV